MNSLLPWLHLLREEVAEKQLAWIETERLKQTEKRDVGGTRVRGHLSDHEGSSMQAFGVFWGQAGKNLSPLDRK